MEANGAYPSGRPVQRPPRLAALDGSAAAGWFRVRLHEASYPYPLTKMRRDAYTPSARICVLPQAPVNGSPVPGLTSLYHKAGRGPWGDARYPGNCSGYLIRDLIRYFRPKTVFDPMSGSGTCRDVCRELDVLCTSKDIRYGWDACDPDNFAGLPTFDFVWVHAPYWRQKRYTDDPRDMSAAPTLREFCRRYDRLIRNLASVLNPGGKLAILMGDYSDHGTFIPLTYYTKLFAFRAGLRQCCTDIVRFSHGASSGRKVYRSSFIPGLHDVCTVFEK